MEPSNTAERTRLIHDNDQPVKYCDEELHNTTEGDVAGVTNPYKRRGKPEDQPLTKVQKMHLFLLVLTFLSTCVYVALTKSLYKPFEFDRINTINSFGDSYTTRYLNMDSLTYACRNCTSAGGPNWVIYLTDATRWVSWDFAYNSAPVNNSIVKQVPTVTDVSTQIRSLYPKLFVSPTKKIANIIASQYVDTVRTQQSTLTTIWVGINDIGLTHDWNDTNALDIEIMQKYQVLIDELIERGVYQFMFINVPPIDRAPKWSNKSNQKVIRSRVKAYNSKLKTMIKNLRTSHSAATFFQYNAWTFFNDLMDHAKDYNMTDIDTFCPDWSHPVERNCKPIGEYFWLNNLHPTFRVHQLMAQDVVKYLSSQ
ncbi:hypothetical protein EDC94DRAFT_621698 [Helicostylum pulchrum]|nr:hypothetical protein EDC94DRAFT_621698 [Helicostylum pulchrum]